MNHILVNCDCLDYIRAARMGHSHDRKRWDTIFADPPDNIGKQYATDSDKITDSQYVGKLNVWLRTFIHSARTVWFSYNAKWSFAVGMIVHDMLRDYTPLEARNCVQTFTFGQHNHNDLGNNYRPLLRLRCKDAPLFPDAIRVPSWRQKNGDKRADPRGRVPGDVFDFTRVVGNSKQRRAWHPTQLNEGLVERCLRLTTPEDGTVLDPFAGTGTTLRVCWRLGNACTLVEREREYCDRIAEEHRMEPRGHNPPTWIAKRECPECGRNLIETSDRWRVCPKGHGRLHPLPEKQRRKS